MTAQVNETITDAPAWLTPEILVIGGVILVALLLWWLIGRRKQPDRAHVAAEQREIPPAPPIAPAPPAPPIAEAPLAPPSAPVFEPEPAAVEEPAPIADEPIAAAAPLDASPASLAADVAAPEPQPEPAAPAPAPASPTADELTRIKGVGPRLAARLNVVGITSFAQIAALTPADAEALDAQLGDFQGRIHRDRWIEQARFLAADDLAGFEGTFGKL